MIRVERRDRPAPTEDHDALEIVLRELTGDGVSQVEITVSGAGRVAIHMTTGDVSAEMAAATARHLLDAADQAIKTRAAYEAALIQ